MFCGGVNFSHASSHSVSAIKLYPPQVLFSTDACIVGGGGVCNNEYFSFAFPQELMDVAASITQREMVTVLIAIKVWCSSWKGLRILVKSDNMACVQVINTGRAVDKFLQACARELIFLACENDFDISSCHITGSRDILPDLLSRIPLDSSCRDKFLAATNGKMMEKHVNINCWRFSCDW